MPPRIVHVISNLGTGGAETMLVRLLEAEPAASGDHAVISLMSGGALAPQIRALGVDLQELGARRSLSTAGLLPALIAALRAAEPDVIQGWMYHANVAAIASRPFLAGRPPVVWNIRQTLQKMSNNRLLTQAVILAGAAFGRATAGIVYNSAVSADQHERKGFPSGRRIIIGNGFDLSRFEARSTARELLCNALDGAAADDALLIGRVARKDPQKDDETMFAAFRRIAEQQGRARLVLIGKGMESGDPELALLAEATGVPERIHFLGERLDVAALTAGFDVAVSSSAHSEGFSNVVAEAMAAGVPAVSTDVGDIRAVLNDEDRIVPPRQPEALAAAIVPLLELDPDARQTLGQSDRDWIAGNFDIASILDRYRQVWRQAATGR